MNRDLAHALQERRQTVERLIRKFETLEQPTPQAAEPQLSVNAVLSTVKTGDDIIQWAKRNFEPGDVLLLETKFRNKLNLHPERVEDANYCRLITLVFYLMATNQCARVYGEVSHRAISAAFSTHLDMYHPLHWLESACYFAELTIQSYIQKARIGEVLDMMQDQPLTLQQELILAQLCLMPESGQMLAPLHFANADEDTAKAVAASHQAQPGADLMAIQQALYRPEQGQSPLTQRYHLALAEAFSPNGQEKKTSVPYYAPNLDLCLRLRSVLTVKDIKKSAAPALLDKLTSLWQILLPLQIDLGAIKDFQ